MSGGYGSGETYPHPDYPWRKYATKKLFYDVPGYVCDFPTDIVVENKAIVYLPSFASVNKKFPLVSFAHGFQDTHSFRSVLSDMASSGYIVIAHLSAA